MIFLALKVVIGGHHGNIEIMVDTMSKIEKIGIDVIKVTIIKKLVHAIQRRETIK